MACRATQMWGLGSLVGAFLDLAIAYLLLCASAVVYFGSIFLGFFGLSLPCTCDVRFSSIFNSSFCLNSLLIDFPAQKVSDVVLSVKRKFPFSGCSCPGNHIFAIAGSKCVNGVLELEGEEALCSSVPDVGRSRDVVKRDSSARAERYDVKGKGAMGHRPRSRLRQRRKLGGDNGKYSSVSSYDPPLHEEALGGEANKWGNGLMGGGLQHVGNDADGLYLEYVNNNRASPSAGWRQRTLASVQMNPYTDEDTLREKDIRSIGDPIDNQQNFNGDEKNAIRILQQALQEEQSACAALYLELEKERSAAASAADEAMAMILRLQEEKASVEMEARQYQRIFEEKSAYDAEEMNILKEILVRRETEKHFLEKEIETYRQMLSLENEELAVLDPNDDDPVQILHQLAASTYKNIKSVNMVPQEKEMISIDNDLSAGSQECKFLEKTRGEGDKELDQVEEINMGHKLAEKTLETCKQQERGAHLEISKTSDLMLDKDSDVYDVHVIGDRISCCGEANLNKCEEGSASSSSKVFEAPVVERVSTITGCPPNNAQEETGADVPRSNSEMTSGLPPIGPGGLSMLSKMRRKSTSSLDSEMLKIDSEVERLRERLKFVQEGREKLGTSVENQERENIQLKLLEDIARQVQEIRHLTQHGKAARQVSLPLPRSKVLSKKRRCRSVSSGLHI